MLLACVLAATGAFLLYQTRGTTLHADEWPWALYRRGNDLGTFLRPWNEHMSLVPTAIYRLLFATVGLRDYLPYRLVVIGLHLLVGALVFVYANRRVGGVAALIATLMMLYLGPAWENFLWPFQMAWLISLSSGIGALLLLDRDDRKSDVAACALVALSLGSSGLGLMIALGVVVEVLYGRRRWRDAWIFAGPLIPYAVWWSHYESPNRGSESGSALLSHNLPLVPSFAAKAAAAALSAVWGLAGEHAQSALAFGWPLLIVAIGLLAWRLTRLRRLPPRVATLLTIALSFWILTAIRRADYSHPYESRYLYVSGLLVILLAIELGRGVALPRKVGAVLAVAAAAAVAINVIVLRDAAAELRRFGPVIKAETGALDIGRPIISPTLVADPYQQIVAGPYFAMERAIGTPAASPAQIAAEPEFARVTADLELIHIHGISLRAGAGGARTGTRPAVDLVTGGTVVSSSRDSACTVFRAQAPVPAAGGVLEVTVPSGGLLLRANGAPATVTIRRFAAAFEPIGPLPQSSRPTALPIAADLAQQRWHVRVRSTASVTVCGLG